MLIVLDTETANGFKSPLIYDFGYVIANDNGEIIKTRSYIIKEVFDDKELFETAYYKAKRPLYEMRLKSGYSKRVSFAYAMYRLKQDIKKYNVEKFAYNSAFDNRAIKSTMDYFDKTKHNPIEKSILDIMKYINKITETNDYKKFCKDNNFMTKHRIPRVQKKAETLFRYLTNNPSYAEEHTALEDSKIELFILNKALGLN